MMTIRTLVFLAVHFLGWNCLEGTLFIKNSIESIKLELLKMSFTIK